MLLAQITDVHLGFDPGNPDELNRQRLDRTLRLLSRMNPLPDLLLATGDLADNGDDRVSYRRWKDAIRDLPFPVYPAMGNHDSREEFLALFPDQPTAGGFVQYAIEDHPVRILVLDTLEIGRCGVLESDGANRTRALRRERGRIEHRERHSGEPIAQRHQTIDHG